MPQTARTQRRTTCSGVILTDGGRRCRKTTLHPSGYCHVHCTAEQHRRECESEQSAVVARWPGPRSHGSDSPLIAVR